MKIHNAFTYMMPIAKANGWM